MADVDALSRLARKYSLQNALEYDGEGQVKSVMGRVFGEQPELTTQASVLGPLAAKAVAEANSLHAEHGAEHVRQLLADEFPDALEKRVHERREGLPELPNSEGRELVFRFAPNPNGPLTLGHSRGVIINSEYARQHGGRIVLRFDDTGIKTKPPLAEAYGWIDDEFRWLTGRAPDVRLLASERMDLYLDKARDCLAQRICYVCTCTADEFKVTRVAREACPCRSRPSEQNLAEWEKMLDGTYAEGEAVVRVLTDMEESNPALRDWPALRIQTGEHPLVGTRYRVWPLLDFQSAIDDEEQGVTHIIRGKDLMDSTRKQTQLYDKLGWTYPETLYWGRVKVHEFGGFSTSQMRADIESGEFSDWDDIRLPTIRALRRRGFTAESLRLFWVELGLTQKDISVPLATLEAHNSGLVDASTPRLSLLRDPVRLALDVSAVEMPSELVLPNHPTEDLGVRTWPLDTDSGLEVLIEKGDLEFALSGDGVLRLKEFADIEVTSDGGGRMLHFEKGDGVRIVHWMAAGVERDAVLLHDFEGELQHPCMLESNDHAEGTLVQLERVGFARIEQVGDRGRPWRLVWTHG